MGSVSKAAKKCGIPHSTLYRWINRHQTEGRSGLVGKSKRPNTLEKQKITDDLVVELIKTIRYKFNFGPQRISLHLSRLHNVNTSSSTVWRVLKANNLPNIKKYRKHGDITRYNRPIPGDRVQIDVTKVGPKCYQLYQVKFRPIKPRSPHLNGKVERLQLTDKAEFYSTIPKKERTLQLAGRLLEWQNFYNYKRPHVSFNGMTPHEKLLSVEHLIPIQPDVTAKYWEKDEEIHSRDSGWYCCRAQ